MPKKMIYLLILSMFLFIAGCGGSSAPAGGQEDVLREAAEGGALEAGGGNLPKTGEPSMPQDNTVAETDAKTATGQEQPASSPVPPAPSSPSRQPSPPSPAVPAGTQPAKFRMVESDGTVFERVGTPQRIVVLSVPTAIIMDRLGIELAGITMTGRTLPPNLAALPEAGIPRDPNIEVIKDLKADLVIISSDFKQMNKAKMAQHNIPTFFIDNQLYEDTFKSIELLGKAFGRETAANQLIRELRTAEEKVLKAVGGRPAPKVLILFGTADSFTMQRSKTFAGNLVQKLGGVNIADLINPGDETAGNIPLSIEQVVAQNPDIIFRISHGTAEETQKIYDREFTTNPIWSAVSAHQNNRVHDLPMELFFSNSGLRVVDSLEHLAGLMYP